ncbi:hypothetical protein C4K26_0016 [Pseudomonas chlororaphis]|uniref:hypothetical protein n=1 Tax=Pseudomonas chlororaphis TaxID=587753 RepID=UPI000F58D268|nr:hypothetical protein [Pseudomonas chlororaphis]AZD05457.1 hypothetical protein C4K26_0016 [Pseudomonas chlororaphis]
MNIDEIIKHSKNLTPKSRRRFIENSLTLINQIEFSVILRGPYRLVLDSNIIMRLEDYRLGKINEGVLSILLVFILIKRLPHHIDLVIRPSVFYEYLRLSNVSSSRQHWEKFKELKSITEDELGSVLFFDGIETYSGAEYYLNLLQSDAKKITKTLRSYEQQDWRFNFFQPPGCGFAGIPANNGEFIIVPPVFAAQGLYKDIGLEYFDERRTSRFFMEHIEKNISECKLNNQQVVERYGGDRKFLLTKVLKLTTKGNLEGLADLDILSMCNVQTQFITQSHGRYSPASIGLSIDTNLATALRFYSSITRTSPQWGGSEQNMEDNMAEMEAFFHDEIRVKEGEGRLRQAMEYSQELLQELASKMGVE